MPERHLALDADGFPVLLADVDPAPAPATKSEPTPAELARRRDVVRELAREGELLKRQDVKERLRGVTSRPLESAEVDKVMDDVHAQRVDDLVDALDQRRRGVKRGRRTLRIHMPRGYLKKAVNSLDDDHLRQVSDRLKARGWDDEDVKAGLSKHLSPARVAKFSPMR